MISYFWTYLRLCNLTAFHYNSSTEYRRDFLKRQITLYMMAQDEVESTIEPINYGSFIKKNSGRIS